MLNMTKAELLKELNASTFVMIKPSPTHGIGVFAIIDIVKGQRSLFSNDQTEWIKLSKEEIDILPAHSKFLVENHCLYDDQHYFVPPYGFKMIDPVIFLNHSDNPNIISINDGEDFEAIRDISVGEELLIDYGAIVAS